MDNQNTHTCTTCGHKWQHGEHGGHDCLGRVKEQRDELLESIQELMDSAGDAINGESDESLKSMLNEPDCPFVAQRQIKAFLKARAAIAKAIGSQS